MRHPRHIAVEGPIGVGKTSLALRLAQELGGQAVLEAPERNPFLAGFYANPRAGALPVQLSFLFQRVLQWGALAQTDLFASVRVADYLLEKDPLFAELNLTGEELELYRQVWRNMVPDPLPPLDLVVYLQAPVPVLQERIARRGIAYEQAIADEYLHRLNAAYAAFFRTFTRAPLLIVDAAALDPIHESGDFEAVLRAVQNGGSGRRYLGAAGIAPA